MDNFSIIIIILTLFFISLSFFLALKPNSVKSKYINNRFVNEELKKQEDYMMKELKKGKIRCNYIKNDSPPYKVGKWVNEMKAFMKKPIYSQIMELKGIEVKNEEH